MIPSMPCRGRLGFLTAFTRFFTQYPLILFPSLTSAPPALVRKLDSPSFSPSEYLLCFRCHQLTSPGRSAFRQPPSFSALQVRRTILRCPLEPGSLISFSSPSLAVHATFCSFRPWPFFVFGSMEFFLSDFFRLFPI